MFTGIIEGLGTISAIRPAGKGKRLNIDADFVLDQSKPGDSIAVNGACLTVVKIRAKQFEVDLSPETLATSTFDKARRGDRLNLERAMRLSDRIDGHLVSGHVDGIGLIQQHEKRGNAILMTIAVPETLTRYIIRKGSVAVDGISLTINTCNTTGFTVSIIPQTASTTTIGMKQKGDAVNIETDMIGKYVERFTRGKAVQDGEPTAAPSGIDMQLLAKSGFLSYTE
ncbi:MAG: riboflavin synthase [Desulfobacterales bacterium]|jgi:riboflavin synthase